MKTRNDYLFSIIVPIHNASSTIVECVDSILAQTITDFEIILINDGSTDNSVDLIGRYMHTSSVRIFHQTNKGVSSARNKGLDNISGTYICFVDSDDFLEPSYLRDLLEEIEKEGVDLIDQSFNRIDSYNSQIFDGYDREQRIKHEDQLQWIDALFNGHTGPFPKLFKAHIINDKFIRFDESLTLFEDVVFLLEYMKYADNGVYITRKANYNYRFMSTSLSNTFYTKHLNTTLLPLQKIFEILSEDFYSPVSQNLDNVPSLKAKMVNLSMFFLETFQNGSTIEKVEALRSLRKYNLHILWRNVSAKNPLRRLFYYLYDKGFVSGAVFIDNIRVFFQNK